MRRMFSKNQLEELAKQTIENASELKVFENITDEAGHKRFIEGNGTPLEQEGFTSVYCKWSLSGSHLLMVLAGTIASGTTLALNTLLAKFTLPSWIQSKIYGVKVNLLEYKAVACITDSYTTETMNVYFDKMSDGVGIYVNVSAFTATSNDAFRVELDLLIDNE